MKLAPYLLRLALAVSVCILGMLTPNRCLAEDPTRDDETQAKVQYETGTSHYKEGRYVEALRAFSKGHELSRKAGFLWNMAECERMLGHTEAATALYERYLKDSPVNAPRRADAEKYMKDLRRASHGAPIPRSPNSPAPSSTTPGPMPSGKGDGNLNGGNWSSRILLDDLGRNKEAESTPLLKQWWFWTGAAAIVATTVIVSIVFATRGGDPPMPHAPQGTVLINWK